MPEFVLDASMTMAWCFADEATPYTTAVRRSLADATALAPSIWPLEVANVMLIAERRGRITEVQTQELIAFLHTLPVEVVVPQCKLSYVFRITMITFKYCICIPITFMQTMYYA